MTENIKIRNLIYNDYVIVNRGYQTLHSEHVEGRPDIYKEMKDIFLEEEYSKMLTDPDYIMIGAEEDGRLTGEVKFILYKGNHYHLTVFTDWDEDIFVDTTDVWDDGDRVGITIAPENIRIVAPAQTTSSIPIVESANKKGSAQ